MCLDTITKTGLNKSGYGWKVFAVRDDVLFGEFQDYRVVFNKWLKAKKVNFRLYQSGFHIYTDHPLSDKDSTALFPSGDNIMLKVVRVKYTKGHTEGIFIRVNVIVADKMKVLPEGWKPNIFQRLWQWRKGIKAE